MCVNDKLLILSMRNTLYILTIIDLKTSYVKVKLQDKSINNNPYEDLKTFYVKVKLLFLSPLSLSLRYLKTFYVKVKRLSLYYY